MKIGSVPRIAPTNPYSEVARKNQVSRQSFQGSDRVEFTENARMFSAALRAARETPEVRMDRVNALKEQIQAGTYKPDTASVVEKMLTRIYLGR